MKNHGVKATKSERAFRMNCEIKTTVLTIAITFALSCCAKQPMSRNAAARPTVAPSAQRLPSARTQGPGSANKLIGAVSLHVTERFQRQGRWPARHLLSKTRKG